MPHSTPPSAAHPILALGSQAPDFSLPGVDGKTHNLADYASSPVLVVVFMCNHCPIAQMYEQRVQALTDDYRDKGVAVVAIQPNDPKAIRIDELDSSDISDSLDEMKIRFEYKHWRYTYLYDGETQSVTRAYGPQATPHVFVFDKDRKLRYEGRMDNNYRKELVKTQDARNAIDAVLGWPRCGRETYRRVRVLDEVAGKVGAADRGITQNRRTADYGGSGGGRRFEEATRKSLQAHDADQFLGDVVWLMH